MEREIPDHLRTLLGEILEQRQPALLHGKTLGSPDSFTRAEREKIVDVLTDELCATGIRADGELNERGLEIDRLIGFFVPFDR